VIDFSSWTASAGTYTARCTVMQAGDQVIANNAVSLDFQVGSVDVGATAIGYPSGNIDSARVIVPQATVKNFGTIPATFTAFFKIDDGTDAIVYSSSKTITALEAGATATATFDTWAKPHNVGSYTTRCSTYIAFDGNNANDAIGGAFSIYAAAPETGWVRKASMPAGAKSKNIKDGGALAALELDYGMDAESSFVFALKGNNRYEYYAYNTEDNTWATKESVPAIGRAGKKKAVKKGAALVAVADPHDVVYAAKGNNSVEFWQYDPNRTGSYVWQQVADVPLGAKALKEGTGAATVKVGDSTFIYLLKGSGTNEFYRYSVEANSWISKASAPVGTSGKPYKNGSALCASDDGTKLYVIKGSYNEMAVYDVATDVWATKTSLPLIGSGGKKKKVKDGAGLAYHSGKVYALKGGNTKEFWSYQADSDKWMQLPDVPAGSGKNVKGGGAITYAGSPTPALYVLNGNNTLDFFKYGLTGFSTLVTGSSPDVQTSSIRNPQSSMRIAPNPFSNATTISYALSRPGNVSLKVYDITGTLVTTLTEGHADAGSYCAHVDATRLARGIYLLKLESEGTTTTTKLIVE